MMTPRQEKILNLIVGKYIKTAEPVSSKLLEKSNFFKLSSATLRNEMNDLERDGYLAQIHTSSGRIPTDRAYRYFVDNLIANEDFEPQDGVKAKVRGAIHEVSHDPREINKIVAQVLSEISDNLVITNISDNNDFYKFGLSGLFELPEFREFDKAFKLTSFFDEFDSMFSEMERDFFGQAVSMMDSLMSDLKISIGHENQSPKIKDETIIFCKYNLPHNCMGSLTMVGPTRMDYAKNISLIKYTKEELNKLAKQI